jgi:hypothetical protein
VLKISLRGNCKTVKLIPANGRAGRCLVRVELDHSIPLEFDMYEIQLFVPVEFATLLEEGTEVTVTLEQNALDSSS